MSEHRKRVRGQPVERSHFVDDTPRSVPISRRDATLGRRCRAFAHIGPISIEPVSSNGDIADVLPVANRNSA
jgi:hypothetical protein